MVTTNINSSNFYTTYNAYPEYAQEITESKRTRGAITGSKKIIIGSFSYLYSLTLYDDKGRVIQMKETNYTGGTDILTNQFDFSGKILRTHLAHSKAGANAQTHTLLTKYTYDHTGRVTYIVKNIDSTGDKTILKNIYNELGQLMTKRLGVTPGGSETSVEDMDYSYTIRGWLSGINKDYVTTPGSTSRFFGETLYYESGFGNNQLNGAIGGIQWKSRSDGIARSYQFTYDNANQLISADFNQQNEGSTDWTKDKVDFSVSGIAYDAGGNILSMKQRGLHIGSIATIDSLTYQYFTNSNQLRKVNDGIPASGNLGDFKDTTLTGDDYVYDVNGNITRDYNRKMHTATDGDGAVYNVLDRPDSMVIAGKATLYYYYDATGIKLRKQVNDYTSGSLVAKNYLYINGFVYLNDTLQYALDGEGKIRCVSPGVYAFDYFLRDHLNNVRAIITDEERTDAYPVASLETSLLTSEKQYYGRLDSGRVNKSTVSGYPNDTYTDPNDFTQHLTGNGIKIGADMLLKVMAGDKFSFRVNSWWDSGDTPDTPVDPLTDLLSILNNNVPGVSGGKATSTELSSGNILSPLINDFLSTHNTYTTSKPKAFINWILFDEQFQYVSGSGFEQVGSSGDLTEHTRTQLPVNKSGYLYIYVSNETPNIDVYFDNLQVTHIRGKLLEESHYYPFGLTMAGISSKALAFGQKNSYKFNGGVELEDEYGVNLYSTFYRQYDPQLGRFNGVDILSEQQAVYSPYHFAGGNPIMYNDPLGDKFDNPTNVIDFINTLMSFDLNSLEINGSTSWDNATFGFTEGVITSYGIFDEGGGGTASYSNEVGIESVVRGQIRLGQSTRSWDHRIPFYRNAVNLITAYYHDAFKSVPDCQLYYEFHNNDRSFYTSPALTDDGEIIFVMDFSTLAFEDFANNAAPPLRGMLKWNFSLLVQSIYHEYNHFYQNNRGGDGNGMYGRPYLWGDNAQLAAEREFDAYFNESRNSSLPALDRYNQVIRYSYAMQMIYPNMSPSTQQQYAGVYFAMSMYVHWPFKR